MSGRRARRGRLPRARAAHQRRAGGPRATGSTGARATGRSSTAPSGSSTAARWGRASTRRSRPAAPPRGEFVGHVCDVARRRGGRGVGGGRAGGRGPVDVAIHVAGIIQVGPVESTTLGHFRAAIDTMLLGPVHLCLAVLPTMLEAGAGPDRRGELGRWRRGGAAPAALLRGEVRRRRADRGAPGRAERHRGHRDDHRPRAHAHRWARARAVRRGRRQGLRVVRHRARRCRCCRSRPSGRPAASSTASSPAVAGRAHSADLGRAAGARARSRATTSRLLGLVAGPCRAAHGRAPSMNGDTGHVEGPRRAGARVAGRRRRERPRRPGRAPPQRDRGERRRV